jgi:hypothetical protein
MRKGHDLIAVLTTGSLRSYCPVSDPVGFDRDDAVSTFRTRWRRCDRSQPGFTRFQTRNFGLGWIDAYQLAHSGKTTVATVTNLEPENHDGCQYAYTVASHTYTRSEETCGTGHQLGDRFAIIYLPGTPSVATMSSPDTALRGQILFNLLVPTLAAGVVVAGRKRRTSKLGRR